MKVQIKIFISALVATTSSLAATPVARLISSEPVDVSGILTPARNFVPLSVGDEITTDKVSATVQFPDGNAVTLQAHSKLRIEQRPSGPVAHVLHGSAIYDVPRSYAAPSHIAGAVSRSSVVGSSVAPAADSAANRSASAAAMNAAAIYREPAARQPLPGAVAPQGASFTGTFVPADSATGSGPSVISPTGVTINLAPVVTTVNGVSTTTYTIVSVSQTITVNGAPVVVTTTPTALVGDVVTVAPPAQGSTGGSITVTTPTGTQVAGATVSSDVQTSTQQAVSTGQVSGVPTTTTVPTPSPVTTGSFSPNVS